MARTFIGELVLRLKDEMSGKAKQVAGNLDSSVDRIQRAARKLNQTSWGGQFEERLRKLGASSADVDKLRVAWDSLHTSMTSKNLSKAMQAMEKSNFKLAATSEFTALAAAAKEVDTNIGRMHSRWKEAAKDMVAYGTMGTLLYGGANAVRAGIVSNAEIMRERARWKDANIPESERDAAFSKADELTTQYPSAGYLNILELARKARAMMGDNERGLAILPDLARAFVALQKAKGTDAAVQELEGFLKGADVAGINASGPKGIDSIREVIAGWVRAAQVEGRDIDTGKFLEFARYGKLAVPGLNNRFLGVTVPAIAQDYGPSQMGNALNMAFKAFVLGSNSQAGKKNLQAQRDLGIRTGPGKGQLVNDQLFGADPYQWVNEILIPALKKKGVDTENNVAVSKAVGELTANSNAATILIRMITQKKQIDRLLQQYDAAIGPESADSAAAQDPFVAWKGFTESLREFSSAIKGMPEAIGILNSLTSGIQSFSTALRNQDGGAQALLAGAGLAGGFAAWKITAGIYGLITAGTNLNTAAFALQAAAASLASGGKGSVIDAVTDGKNGKGPGGLAWALGFLKKYSPYGAMLLASGDSNRNSYLDASAVERQKMRDRAREAAERYNRTGGYLHLQNRSGSPDDRDLPASVNPYDAATEATRRRQAFEADTGPRGNTPGLDQYFDQDGSAGTPISGVDLRSTIANVIYELMKPTRDQLFEEVPVNPTLATNFADERLANTHRQNAESRQAAGVSSNPQVDMSGAKSAAAEADQAGRQIKDALGISVTPHVDTSQIDAAIAKANALAAALSRANASARTANASVSREMNRNFTDHGVRR